MRLSRNASLILTVALTLIAGVAWGAVPSTCAPPSGFKDTPHPAIAPIDQLVSHTEEVIVNRSLDEVLAEGARTPLNQAIRKSNSLPGVSGTYELTSVGFGKPGSRRLVCLTDGSTTEEEVLEHDRDKNSAQFRYVVWKVLVQTFQSPALEKFAPGLHMQMICRRKVLKEFRVKLHRHSVSDLSDC